MAILKWFNYAWQSVWQMRVYRFSLSTAEIASLLTCDWHIWINIIIPKKKKILARCQVALVWVNWLAAVCSFANCANSIWHSSAPFGSSHFAHTSLKSKRLFFCIWPTEQTTGKNQRKNIYYDMSGQNGKAFASSTETRQSSELLILFSLNMRSLAIIFFLLQPRCRQYVFHNALGGLKLCDYWCAYIYRRVMWV